MNILIIADSRGAGLQAQLNKLGHATVKVLIQGGAGFEMSVLRSMADIKSYQPQLIIIISGICDLTVRNRATRVTYLRHTTVKESVEHVLNSAKSALDLLRGLGEYRISLATITGIDLTDYNNPRRKNMTTEEYREYNSHNKRNHPQQDTLNASVLEINRQVTLLNQSNSTPTVWLGGVVHTHSKRKTRHYYIRLYDGCHPDLKTQIEWSNQIHKAILRITMPTQN